VVQERGIVTVVIDVAVLVPGLEGAQTLDSIGRVDEPGRRLVVLAVHQVAAGRPEVGLGAVCARRGLPEVKRLLLTGGPKLGECIAELGRRPRVRKTGGDPDAGLHEVGLVRVHRHAGVDQADRVLVTGVGATGHDARQQVRLEGGRDARVERLQVPTPCLVRRVGGVRVEHIRELL